jgi:hypothetical protein
VAVVQGDPAAATGTVDGDTIHATVPTATRHAVRIRRRYQIGCATRRGLEKCYGACCVMVIAVPVIVRIATRTTPVFCATANCTVPFPAPEAPCMIVRKLALLVAVHVHELGVVTEIDAVPPEAGNVVVVTPVMIWHPDGPVVELDVLSLHATAKSSATIENVASIRRKRWQMSMPGTGSTDRTSSLAAVQLG